MADRLALLGGEPMVKEDVTAEWPQFDFNEKEALLETLESRSWYFGPKCREFEEVFAQFQDAQYGVACTGGTVALEGICRAAGIGIGDEVITSPYTFIGTCAAILKAGATVIFADIDLGSNNIDPDQIEKVVTSRTKAIMPVHFGGLACDMYRIQDVADRNNLVVLEDACHGWGAKYKDRGLGSWGLASGFSFQQSKNMTCGDGGIALTNDEVVADAIECSINAGRSRYDRAEERIRWGGNHRMSEFQAALLLCQMKRVNQHIDIREENVTILTRTLSDIDGIEPVHRIPEATRVSWHQFGARFISEAFEGISREVFMDAIQAEGVPVGSGYPEPVYKSSVFQHDWKKSSYKPFAWPLLKDSPDYLNLHLPNVEQYCKERITLSQRVLLASEVQMQNIARAFVKVRENAKDLKKTPKKFFQPKFPDRTKV